MTPTESYNILVYSMSLQPGSMLSYIHTVLKCSSMTISLYPTTDETALKNQSSNATNEYFTHYIKFIELSDHSTCFQCKQRVTKLLLKVI